MSVERCETRKMQEAKARMWGDEDGVKMKGKTHSAKKMVSSIRYATIFDFHAPSTAAMTTRSMAVSVAVVMLVIRSKIRQYNGPHER